MAHVLLQRFTVLIRMNTSYPAEGALSHEKTGYVACRFAFTLMGACMLILSWKGSVTADACVEGYVDECMAFLVEGWVML